PQGDRPDSQGVPVGLRSKTRWEATGQASVGPPGGHAGPPTRGAERRERNDVDHLPHHGRCHMNLREMLAPTVQRIATALPSLLIGLGILLAGYVLAKIAAGVVSRVL